VLSILVLAGSRWQGFQQAQTEGGGQPEDQTINEVILSSPYSSGDIRGRIYHLHPQCLRKSKEKKKIKDKEEEKEKLWELKINRQTSGRRRKIGRFLKRRREKGIRRIYETRREK
jgi:hypothetical protein